VKPHAVVPAEAKRRYGTSLPPGFRIGLATVRNDTEESGWILIVIAGLDPAIHANRRRRSQFTIDHRVEPGGDERNARRRFVGSFK